MATDADGDSATLNFTLAVATANAVGVTRVDFIGTPRTGDTYGAGEEIWVRVSLTAIPSTVSITGSPRLGLTIGNHVRQAFYDAHFPNALYFIYRVRGSDVDLDGIDIADNALTLNGATLRAGGVDFNLDLAAAAIGSCNCKVNGGGLTFTAAVAPQRYTVNAAGQTTLPAATGGSGAVRYRLGDTPALPRGLSFDRSTRVISGTPTTTSLATEYELIATDAADSTATLNFQLSVEEQPRPVFTQEIGAQRYRKDRAIYVGLPAATGGTGALAYGLRPELPAGLTYNGPTDTTTGGAIVGMPAVTLTETAYALTVTDANSRTARLTFPLSVVDVDTQPTFPQAAEAQHYREGIAVAMSLPPARGGDGVLSYELRPELPAGLTYKEPTRETTGGAIVGMPTTTAPAATYTLTATEEDGDDVAMRFAIAVVENARPVFTRTVNARYYAPNVAVETTLPVATGGDGALRYALGPDLPAGLTFNAPVTYSLNATLPGGLTFDAVTRRIAGTPTAPKVAMTYTLTATDNDGNQARLPFTLSVAARVPTVTAVGVEQLAFGRAFATENKMTAFVTFSEPVAVSGSPRLALTIGTQTRQAEYLMAYNNGVLFRYRVQAADGDADGLSIAANALILNGGSIRAGGVDASLDLGTHAFANAANLKGNVQPAPAFTQTVAPQRYRKGTAVAVTLPAASGGTSALEYALSPVLPFRLTFDRATRTISGTPTVRFDQTEYALTAHDADADRSPSDAVTLTFSLAVAGGIKPAFGAPFSVPSAVVGHVVAMSLPAGG